MELLGESALQPQNIDSDKLTLKGMNKGREKSKFRQMVGSKCIGIVLGLVVYYTCLV